MNIILLGAPGSGKGTQAEKLCREYNLIQLSTGDILRENRRLGTNLGKQASKYLDGGSLVPDDVMIQLVRSELVKPHKSNGFILDGFPRTVPQAESLEVILNDLSLKLNAVIVLDTENDEIIRRLSARRTCPKCGKTFHLMFNPPKTEGICDACGNELYQRPDDTPNAIRHRLEVYANQTHPLIEFYEAKKLARHIPGMLAIDEVYKHIKEVLE